MQTDLHRKYLCILCKARRASEVDKRLPYFKLYIMSQGDHRSVEPALTGGNHLPSAQSTFATLEPPQKAGYKIRKCFSGCAYFAVSCIPDVLHHPPACVRSEIPWNVEIPLWGQVCVQKQHIAIQVILHHCISCELIPAKSLIWAAWHRCELHQDLPILLHVYKADTCQFKKG